jgi:hypothetical protein
MGESVCIVKNNTEASVFGSKESWLEVNADKSKYVYMVMSRDQNTGRSQNIKTGTSSSERSQTHAVRLAPSSCLMLVRPFLNLSIHS